MREVSVSLVLGPRLALDEAAGELAGGVGSLAVLDLEREEVAAGDGITGDSGDEDGGIAETDHDRAMGLLGELSGFEDERAVTKWISTRAGFTATDVTLSFTGRRLFDESKSRNVNTS